MGIRKTSTSKKVGMPKALAMGWGLEIILLFVGISFITFLVSSEKIAEESVEYGAICVLLFVSFLGSMWSAKVFCGERLLICLLNGFVLFITMMSVTALFFDNHYQNIATNGILILAGSGAAVLLGLRKGNGQLRRKTSGRKLYKLHKR